MAKLVAIGVTLGLATAAAVAGAWFYTLVLFEPLPILGWVASGVLDWLFLMAWVAITFLASTLTRSSLAAAGIGIVALIGIGVLGIVPALAPWLPTGSPVRPTRLRSGSPARTRRTPIVGTVLLIVAAGPLAWLSFRRQELVTRAQMTPDSAECRDRRGVVAELARISSVCSPRSGGGVRTEAGRRRELERRRDLVDRRRAPDARARRSSGAAAPAARRRPPGCR